VLYPVAIETAGILHYQAIELAFHLFQQLSVALQRKNAVSFQSTFAAN